MEGMIKIWESHEFYQVDLARQKLEENGIEAFVVNKVETIAHTMGMAELYVSPENVSIAEEILHIFHKENAED